jgi:acetyl esterase/lipase
MVLISGKVADNAASLNSNPELGFLVAGVSAGGSLSAVLCLLARDNNLSPPLTGAFLSAPSAFHRDSVPQKFKSRWLALEQNKAAPFFNLPMYDYVAGEFFLSHCA